MDFLCDYCKKTFSSENRLLIHLCEKKRRHLNKDEMYVKIGFMAYQTFFRIQYPNKKIPNYDAFVNSKLYIAFVKFGRYIISQDIINKSHFIEFLVKAPIAIDDWTKPHTYEIFVRETLKKETPTTALERSILLMESWSQETGEHWTDFFKKISTHKAILWIKTGRISPWILYTAKTASDLFNRMNDEQLGLIEEYIDTKVWKAKMKLAKEDVKWLKQELDNVKL